MDAVGFGHLAKGVPLGVKMPGTPGFADGQVGFIAAIEQLAAGPAISPLVKEFNSGGAVPLDIDHSHGLVGDDAGDFGVRFESEEANLFILLAIACLVAMAFLGMVGSFVWSALIRLFDRDGMCLGVESETPEGD